MAVAPLATKYIPQISDWSIEPPVTSHQASSYAVTNNNNSFEYGAGVISNQQQPVSMLAPIAVGLTFGLLIGGIALSAVVTLWLTPTIITTTTTTAILVVTAFWNFNNNTKDLYNNYNGVAANTPTYVTGYTGLVNTALFFNAPSSQYVTVASPFLNLTYRSFTIEIWLYPTTLTSDDYGLFGQCQAYSMDHCLMYTIRNYQAYLGFNSDDQAGVTNISINTWNHVAFVYDYSTSTQLVYLNGFLESSRSSNPYKGMSGAILIGAINNGTKKYFTGYIDQVSLITRTKSAAEILIDATLVCYYSFDSNLYTDSGPLGLNASGVNISTNSSVGRINGAISFTSALSYFVADGFTKLSVVGQPYSMSIWIKPTSVINGTIIHVSTCKYTCSVIWCVAFMGFTSNGHIAIQSWGNIGGVYLVTLTGPFISVNVWTHVAQTYSANNGMRLYINGTLFNQTSTFTYDASTVIDYVFLGSFPFPSCVINNAIAEGQYYGLLDEFRVFSRQINATEVTALANP